MRFSKYLEFCLFLNFKILLPSSPLEFLLSTFIISLKRQNREGNSPNSLLQNCKINFPWIFHSHSLESENICLWNAARGNWKDKCCLSYVRQCVNLVGKISKMTTTEINQHVMIINFILVFLSVAGGIFVDYFCQKRVENLKWGFWGDTIEKFEKKLYIKELEEFLD